MSRIVHDFRCSSGHVTEQFVERGVHQIPCPECSSPAVLVFLSAPKLDWLGMSQGASAGPEFVDRFERIHKKEAARERKLNDEPPH